MSLRDDERARTGEELKANFALSGLTLAEVEADLGCTPSRLRSTLDSSGDPVDVWELRDYLEQAVTDAGGEPIPFTILTESARSKANGWFGLRTAPRHA